jgi:hypothetical protein
MNAVKLPIIAAAGMADGLPIDEACQRMFEAAQSLSAAAEKAPGRDGGGFAERLRAAVKARVRSRNASNKPQAAEQSFGEQLAAKAKQLARGRKVTVTR